MGVGWDWVDRPKVVTERIVVVDHMVHQPMLQKFLYIVLEPDVAN